MVAGLPSTTMRFLALGGLVALVGLAGCPSSPANPAPVPPPATPSPPDWTITPTGAGGLVIGAPDAGAGVATGPVSGTAESCRHVRPSGAPAGVRAMIVDGEVVRLEVSQPGVETLAGVAVGSTVAQVRQAYGDRLSELPHKYTDGQYLVVDADAERQIVFETDGERVTGLRAGRTPEVRWVEGCA